MTDIAATSPRQASAVVVAAFLMNDCKYSVEVFSRALLALTEAGYVRVGRVCRPPTWPQLKTLLPLGIYAVLLSIPALAVGQFALRGKPWQLTVEAAPAVFFGLIVLLTWAPARVALMSRPAEVVFLGEVVKHWLYEDPEAPTTYKLCVDDGLSTTARTFYVSENLYHRFGPGETVRVRYSPLWRSLLDLEPPGPDDH